MRKLAVLLGAVAALTFGTAAQAASVLSGTLTVQTFGNTMSGTPLVNIGNASTTVTSGNLDIDLGTGAFNGGTLYTADYTLIIDISPLFGLPAGTIQTGNVSITNAWHGLTGGEIGTPSGNTVSYASWLFDQAGGSVSCSGNPTVCGSAPTTADPQGPSNAFVAILDGVSTTTIVIDTGVIVTLTGDQRVVSTWELVLDGPAVPEPASLILLGGSLAGLAFLRRRAA